MNLRALTLAGLALTGLMAAQITTGGAEATAPRESRPNIILIQTDDMRASDLRYMPNTRRLLSNAGTRFLNAVAPNPKCCPARASLQTGQYDHNTGVYQIEGYHGSMEAYDRVQGGRAGVGNNVGSWLQDAGYNTAFFGKLLFRYAGVASQWDNPNVPGWTRWDAFWSGQSNYKCATYTNTGALQKFCNTHIDRKTTDRTVVTINRWAPSRKPFFLFVNYQAPHKNTPPRRMPRPERKYANAWSRQVNPATYSPAFNERDMSDKPPIVANVAPRSRSEMQQLFLQRIRTLQTVDESVARIVWALRSKGELANTTIIFTSDHGYSLGEHRHDGKDRAFTEVLRVPLIVRGLGFPAGTRSGRWVAAPQDITATIAHIAGATPNRVLDGSSLRQQGGNYPIPISNGDGDAKSALDSPYLWSGVWWGRYIFTTWKDGSVELYDLKTDPWQQNSVHDNPDYEQIEQRLTAIATDLRDCVGTGTDENSCHKQFAPLPAPGA